MKNRCNFLIIIVLLQCIVSACNTSDKPKKFIGPEPRLVRLLVDYHMGQGVASTDFFRKKTSGLRDVNISDSLLKANGYTRKNLDSTVLYYAQNLEQFELLYDKVITELSRMQAQLQGNMKAKKDTTTKKSSKPKRDFDKFKKSPKKPLIY